MEVKKVLSDLKRRFPNEYRQTPATVSSTTTLSARTKAVSVSTRL